VRLNNRYPHDQQIVKRIDRRGDSRRQKPKVVKPDLGSRVGTIYYYYADRFLQIVNIKNIVLSLCSVN